MSSPDFKWKQYHVSIPISQDQAEFIKKTKQDVDFFIKQEMAEMSAIMDGREFSDISDRPPPLLKRISRFIRYKIYRLIKGWEFED